jgi:predicted DNA-binding transcriptional regulator AlpA
MQHARNDIDLRTSRQVADLLGVSVECLVRWRQNGEGPSFIRIGSRRIAYDMRDLAAWLISHRQCPEDERFAGRSIVDIASVQEAM